MLLFKLFPTLEMLFEIVISFVRFEFSRRGHFLETKVIAVAPSASLQHSYLVSSILTTKLEKRARTFRFEKLKVFL